MNKVSKINIIILQLNLSLNIFKAVLISHTVYSVPHSLCYRLPACEVYSVWLDWAPCAPWLSGTRAEMSTIIKILRSSLKNVKFTLICQFCGKQSRSVGVLFECSAGFCPVAVIFSTTPSWSSLWLCGLEASGFLKPYITLSFSIKWHLFRLVQCSAESPVFATVVPTEWKASGLCQTHVTLSADLWFRLALILMTMKNPFSVCVQVC